MNCEFPEGRSREYCVAEERKEGSYITLATVSTIRSLTLAWFLILKSSSNKEGITASVIHVKSRVFLKI